MKYLLQLLTIYTKCGIIYKSVKEKRTKNGGNNMDKEVLIFGHKSPDTDSITSSIVMENLEKQLGNKNAKAVRLGNVNKETRFVLDYLGMKEPEYISDIENGQNVILVDHNETTQTVENIANAKILKVIDHHTMNFIAPYQLYYRAEPVGCTQTVLYKMYKENDVQIDKNIATLMLSAIASDTLVLKSPTTTAEDVKAVRELEKRFGLDIDSYGVDMLKAGTDISDYTPEQVINIDSKLFEQGNKKFRIAQVNTADLDSIFKNQVYFEEAINEDIKKENLDFYVFAATDIINSNSKIISLGNDVPVVEKAYGVSIDNHTAMLENVVSRKKQMLPPILEALNGNMNV